MVATAEIDLLQEDVLTRLPMPITLRPSVPMSDEELIAFSRRSRPYRIERNARGELEIMSPLGLEGGHWEAWISAQLSTWAEKNGAVAFSPNVGFTLPDGAVRSPDASCMSQQRWDGLSGSEKRGFGRICPEFVIELRSPSDPRAMLETKMQMWIDSGAQLAWMIDPYAGTVSIYRPDAGVEVLERPEFVEADGPVAGFRLITAKLWGER